MTTPTNWPNPERPGVPMFPERDGWHFLAGVLYPDFWMMDLWNAGTKSWGNGSMLPDLAATRCVYGGPVRNPTQIAEMLAAEREICAKTCDAIALAASSNWKATAYDPDNRAGDAAEETAEICAQKIRNLGAAP